jgi:leucyl aminopeptidase (aminopeptidase T)
VGIVTDTNQMNIAEALMSAAYAIGAPVLSAAMKSADVLIMPTTYALSHCQATKESLSAGVRIMGLREVTEDTFLNGAITADYQEIYTFTNRLADAMVPGSVVRMTTASGTDITMSKKGQFVLRSAGLMRGDLRFTGLPTGEAAFTPLTIPPRV